MKIVKLMISEFIDHLKSNLLTAALMAVVSLILIVFISIYLFEKAKYEPFVNLKIDKGFYSPFDAEEYLELAELEGIENIYRFYFDESSLDVEDFYVRMLGYEAWVYEHWQAELSMGQWFSKELVDEYIKKGEIPVVLAGKTSDYRVGDLIEISTISAYDYDNNIAYSYKYRIIGIISEDAGLIGDAGIFEASEVSYESAYFHHTEYTDADTALFLVPVECYESNNIEMLHLNKMFIKYEEGISKKDEEDLNRHLYQRTQGNGITMNEFYQISDTKLFRVILSYAPFMITGLIILLVSMYALSYLTVANCTEHLAIYTLIGSSKRSNYLILLGNVAGTILLSLTMFFMGLDVYKNYAYSHQIIFRLTDSYRLIVGLAYLLFFIFMSLCMFLVFRKKTTRGMLISLHK